VRDVISEDVTRFTALLNSRAPERRVEGVQGLSHLKHWPAEEAILRLLDDSSFDVRREALLALCRIGTARSVPRLMALLENSSWELRENAALGLQRMTAQEFSSNQRETWLAWWNASSLAEKRHALFAVASATHTNGAVAPEPTVIRRGRRVLARSASAKPASCPERREALRALRHLADGLDEAALLKLLAAVQTPPLDLDERAFICEALERVGTTNAITTLAAQRSDAAAWALGRIGGADAERALLNFPPSLGMLLALDRLHSTNTAALIPLLVSQMGQITFRSQPDDVMNDELQPIQRVGVNLIRRSGLAPAFIECVLHELEDTMKPPIAHGPRPAHPPEWNDMFKRMRSELKSGFVREDGSTTSQPLVTMCYLLGSSRSSRREEARTISDLRFQISDTNQSLLTSAATKRLTALLNHPAIVPRVYVGLALGRMQAREALPALRKLIEEGYAFSDSTALASGKHFDQSQTVRWRGFLCMALGRMGGDEARLALERYASDTKQPRDIRYSSVVGLRFIGSPKSLPVLVRIAEEDVIWMVRDEARRTMEDLGVVSGKEPLAGGAK